ncbi:MAG: UvrD-helicase domain-containing protein [Traorella sp.]
MSKHWNKEQLEAIQTRNTNILVSASAGSGKTGVLVQRLVDLVTIDHIEIDEILAMTFSEDAASEMKKRLSKEITSLVRNANEDDQIYLNSQLSKLSNAHISTIHSFCYSIVKKYYYLLGLSNKRVASLCDEGTLKIYQNQALEEVLYQKQKINTVSFQKLCSIISNRPEDLEPIKDTLFKIANMANSQSDPVAWLNLCKKNYSLDAYSKDSHIYQVFLDYWQSQLNNYKQSFEALIQQFNEHGINEEKRFNKLMIKYDVIRDYFFDDFDELRNQMMVCAKISLPTSFDASNTIFKENRDRIIEIEDEILSIPPKNVMMKMTEEIVDVVDELIDCVLLYFENIERIKNDKEVIDFSDMEHFAIKLLQNHENVASYYRNLFKQIMVDEFQDSNDVQDELVRLICRENNVFRVGDVKQSIYGFRHALPSIMQSYKDKEDQFNKVIRFNRNYRSDATIVEFNNVLYEILMNISGFDSLPFKEEDLSQIGMEQQKENNSAIVFHALSPELKSYENEKINKDVYKAEYIAHQILLESKNRPFSDFAVLVRNNSKMNILKDVFQKYNIPCYMNQKTGFYESRSIQLLISMLESMNNPDDDFYFASILTSVFFNFDSNQLALVSLNKKESYYQYLSLHDPKLLDNFNRIKNNHYTMSEMIQEIFKWNHFYESCSLQDQTNCDYFYQIAYSYEQTISLECSSFLSYINQLKEQETAQTSTIGKNDNVVRFMSIHNSKGLEFPVVYLWSSSSMKKKEVSDMVLCDNELGIGINIMQFPYQNIFKSYQRIAIEQKKNRDELEEEIRILYVATTRPKKQLHIVDFLDSKLDLQHGINYSKVNARKGTTSWILQTMASLGRDDLFRIEYVDELWENNSLPNKLTQKQALPRYQNKKPIEIISPSSNENTYFEILPLSFEKKHNAAKLGTLYHAYIEHLPNCYWNKQMIQDISNQYHLDINSKLIHDLLNLNENQLFNSLRKTAIYHEYPFIVQDDAYVYQGFIDYISFGDIITILDFKSDFVNDEQTLINRYESQLNTYQKAISLLFPGSAIKTYIYSFHLNQMIEL